MIRKATRLAVVHGVWLPYTVKERLGPEHPYNARKAVGAVAPRGTILEEGSVFVPNELIYELADQGIWDSQFGSAFLIHDKRVATALVQAELAVEETRGGYHLGDRMASFIQELENQQ